MKPLNNDDIRDVISDLKADGYDIRIRDIAFVFLLKSFDDASVVFKSLFGSSTPISVAEYRRSNAVLALSAYMEDKFFTEEEEVEVEEKPSEEMSYDELKRGLEADLKALVELRDNPMLELDAKEMAAISGRIADIRVKLTEKFGTVEKAQENRVVVNQKYNSICPYCRHEVAIDLIGRQKY